MTSPGATYEAVVIECVMNSCRKNGLEFKRQSHVGTKPGGGKHIVDWELWMKEDSNRRALLSAKIQNVSGTADEKIPYEVLKLLHAMRDDPRYRIAWLSLGGTGWGRGLVNYYRTTLPEWIPEMAGRVRIVTTDELFSLNLLIP